MKTFVVKHFLLAAVVTLAGCSRFQRKQAPKPFVPPPPVVRTMTAPPLVLADPPPIPGLYLDIADITVPAFLTQFEFPDRPPAPPPRPKPPVQAQPQPVEPVEQPVPPPVPVPKLTRILSEEELRSYRAEVDDSTRSAERILEAAARRRLDATQIQTSRQVKALIDQARSQREPDLVSARNLARRAIILARDLERTFR